MLRHRWFLSTLSFLLLFSGCSSQPETEFKVSLTLVDQEVSEDSNSRTEVLLIDGYKGRYTWTYDGYHPNDDFETEKDYSFRLTDEQMHDLTLLIRENGLMVSREATVSTGEPWTAFDLQWEMAMGGQSASGHVIGEPASWEDWDSTDNDSFVQDESLFATEQIMNYVQELVED